MKSNLNKLPALALLLCLPALAQNNGTASQWTEKMLVERLNKAASHFETLTAKLQYTKFTKAIDHRSIERGRLYVRKNRGLLIDMQEPEPKKIRLTQKKAEIYFPKAKQIQEYNLSKHRSLIDQFLLLGFGTKGNDLKKSYVITVLGETKMDSKIVLLVELTPKEEKIRRHVHKIHIWFDLASWTPVQQKFFETGGDHLTANYTEVKVNIPLRRNRLRLNAPRGTKRIKPQGGF